jgi:hypothetical protein
MQTQQYKDIDVNRDMDLVRELMLVAIAKSSARR